MTAARSAKYRLGELLNMLGTDDITDEEAAVMAEILERAYDRKYPAVVNLTLRRPTRQRRR